MVGAVPACVQCEPAIKIRQSRLSGSGSAQAGTPTQPYPGAQPQTAPPYARPSYDASEAAVAKARGEHNRNTALGLIAAFVIGTILSIAVLKILFYAHAGISWLYVGIGYGIGFGIWKFTGRGSVGLAAAAVGIMIVSLGIAHIVFAADMLNAAKASGDADQSITLFDAVMELPQMFSPMHWICIVIGLFACWRGVEGQSR
jgi:hypothetical protein